LSAAALSDPTQNILPVPDFLVACSPPSHDESPNCLRALLHAVNNARAISGLPAMALPTNWASLTPPEQLFVVTNLERTARGLQSVSAMATGLDAASAEGAAKGKDPVLPPGFPWTMFGSNWAGGTGNPLEAMYYWMYDDGLGSSNVDCSSSNLEGCWDHRKDVLLPLRCTPCVMGAASGTTAQGTASVTEILVDTQGSPGIDFSWAQEQPYLVSPQKGTRIHHVMPCRMRKCLRANATS